MSLVVVEEHTKGSLEIGKLADLVILDQNPLGVDPMAIKDIQVIATVKEGKTIYQPPVRSAGELSPSSAITALSAFCP